MNNGYVLECCELRKAFVDGKHELVVLHGVNLRVAAGEQVAIMGRSGSGKSTLLQLLGGLDQPSSGMVSILGHNLAGLTADELGLLRNKHVGFIYQMHHLLSEFTALENIALPLLIAATPVAVARKRALELLVAVGLEGRAEHVPGRLSGGERQRVAIARALVTNPACVLADEPTGNLDDENAGMVLELMSSLNRQHGTALIVVTHDQEIAGKMSRTCHLQAGILG